MRWMVLLLLVAVAVLAIALLLPSGEETTLVVGGPRTPGEVAPFSPPTLAGRRDASREGTSAHETRALVGRVLRGGKPVAARIEVWSVARLASHADVGLDPPLDFTRRLEPIPAGGPLVKTTAGPDGAFVIPRLPRGLVCVVATAEDGARARVQRELPGGEAPPVGVTLTLPTDTYTLRGRCIHADGRPWRGMVRVRHARDWRWYNGHLPGDVPLVATDENGNFEVRGLASGRVDVSAFLPGAFDSSEERVLVPRRDPVELVVDRGLTLTQGRVLSDADGRPIAGAVVHAYPFGSNVRAVTDATGAFEALWRWGCEVIIRAPGFTPVAHITTGAGRTFMMSPVGRLVGRVIPPDGQPRSGIRVMASRLRLTRWSTGVTTMTRGDGTFEIREAHAGRVEVRAVGDGLLSTSPAEARTVVEVPAGGVVDVTLNLTEGATLSGRVVDADGTPVAGARLLARRHPLKGSAGGPWTNSPWDEVTLCTATSNADGRFVLRGLVPKATHVVTIDAPGFLPVRYAPLFPGPDSVDLRVDRGHWIDIQVDGPSGPVEGAEVAAGSRRAWAFGGTDKDGRVRVGPVPTTERLSVWAYADGHLDAGRYVEKGAVTAAITMRRAYTITGRLLSPDGTPVTEYAWISVRKSGVESAPGRQGTFELRGLPPGTHTVTASRGGEKVSQDVDAGTAGVVLRLAPAERTGDSDSNWLGDAEPKVRVRVLAPDGTPVARAFIISQGDVLGGEGQVFALLRSCTVVNPRSAAGIPLPLANRTVFELPAGVAEHVLTLPHEALIEGVAVDPNGRAVVGVEVTAHRRGEGQSDPWLPGGEPHRESVARTDAQGRFCLRRLTAGRAYEVRAAPPYGHLPTTADAIAGRAGLRLRLEASAQVVVRVVDPKGEPLAKASVAAFEGVEVPDDWSHRGGVKVETDKHGKARLPRLVPGGVYHLRVRAKQKQWGEALLVPWRPTDTTVRLEVPRTVTGTVQDTTGNPCGPIAVVAKQVGARESTARVDEDGRFRVEGLRSGPVIVKAATLESPWRSDVLSSLYGEPREVRAGDTGVALTIDGRPSIVVLVKEFPRGTRDVVATLETVQGGDAGMEAWMHSARVDEDGVARFWHADPGARYTLWVGSVGGRYALEQGVGSGRHEVALLRGGTVRGRLGKGVEASHVVLRGRPFGELRRPVQPGGRFEISGLPPGSYAVGAELGDGLHGPYYSSWVEAEPGDDVVLGP